MNIYVYQLGDDAYGAGFIESVCAKRGKIVERWPINTQHQIEFVKRHGSSFNGVYDRVKELAEKAENRLDLGADQLDEQCEAMLIELASLPFKQRVKAGFDVMFGRYGRNECY